MTCGPTFALPSRQTLLFMPPWTGVSPSQQHPSSRSSLGRETVVEYRKLSSPSEHRAPFYQFSNDSWRIIRSSSGPASLGAIDS